MQCRVTVYVGQMVQGAHAQQETCRGRFPEHAGRHQGGEAFEVRYIRVHARLWNVYEPYYHLMLGVFNLHQNKVGWQFGMFT